MAIVALAVAGMLVFLAPGFAERTAWARQGAEWIGEQAVADAHDGADVAALVDIARARGPGRFYAGHALELGLGLRGRSGARVRDAPERGHRGRRVRPADVVALGTVRVPVHRHEPRALRPVRRALPDPSLGPATPRPGGEGRRTWAPRALGDAGPELRRSRGRPAADLGRPDQPRAAPAGLVPLGPPGQGREPRRRVRGGARARTHRERRRPTGHAGGHRRQRGRRPPGRAGHRDGDRGPAGDGDAEGVVRPALAGDRGRHLGGAGDDRAELRRADRAGRQARGPVRVRTVPEVRPPARDRGADAPRPRAAPRLVRATPSARLEPRSRTRAVPAGVRGRRKGSPERLAGRSLDHDGAPTDDGRPCERPLRR